MPYFCNMVQTLTVLELAKHGGTGANQYTKSRGSNTTSAKPKIGRGADYILARAQTRIGRPKKEESEETFDNVQDLQKAPTGNAQAAGLRKLHKDRPDLYPRPSFLSHAAKLHYTWPELFGVDTKKLRYDDYRSIAISRLEPEQKNKLRVSLEIVSNRDGTATKCPA
jgi:hypothetical protein